MLECSEAIVRVLRSAVVAALVFLPLTGSASQPPVALEVEVIRNPLPPAIDAGDALAISDAIRSAVAANDRPRFEAALARAGEIAGSMPLGEARNALRKTILVYSDIDAMWSFAETNPTGAFYDDDALPGLHERLAADYPGYAAFIADESIVDRTGRTFFPTAETRSFLLKQLVISKPRPHVTLTAAARPVHHSKHVAPPALPVPSLPPGVTTTDVLASDIAKAAPPVIVVKAEPAVAQQANAIATEGPGGASIFFVVLALIAAGVVTLFVKTPQDTPAPSLKVAPPAPAAEPQGETRGSSERIA